MIISISIKKKNAALKKDFNIFFATYFIIAILKHI